MNDTLYIRLAVAADLARLMEIFSAARSFMRSSGNFSQWTGGYPSPELVSDGISRGEQYAVCRHTASPSARYELAPHPLGRAGVPDKSETSVSTPRAFFLRIPCGRMERGRASGRHSDKSPSQANPAAMVEALNNDEIVGTFWFSTAPEPTYTRIFDGAWLSENDVPPLSSFPPSSPESVRYEGKPRARKSPAYGVVHRLASDGSASGVGALVLRWALAGCGDVRVDTHRANSLMQSLLRREGFTHCGTIFLADGSRRDAFERILSPAEAKKMVRTEVAMNRNFSSERRSGKAREAYTPVLPPVRYEAQTSPPLTAISSSPAPPSVLYEARTVALFCALPSEPSVDFLLDKWLTVKRLALPVVTSAPGSPPRMEFREYTGRECLRRGRFGILEPADTPLVPPEQIDVMLVPGVAYTVDGQRLGRGGGFYDRYLSAPAAARIYKVGVCAPTALVEWLPMEAHDVVMNEIWIVS